MNKKRFFSKTKIFVLLSAIVCFASVTFSSVAANQNIFKEAGMIEKAKLNQIVFLSEALPENSYKILADSFQITDAYFDATVDELMLSGYSKYDAIETAEKILLEKFALYNAAKNAGCIVADKDVLSVIQSTKDGLNQAVNKQDYYDYLEGIGLSEEDYWKSQFENVKIYESIALYRQSILTEYIESRAESDFDEDAWNSYWNTLVSDAISSEHVQIAGNDTVFKIDSNGEILVVAITQTQ